VSEREREREIDSNTKAPARNPATSKKSVISYASLGEKSHYKPSKEIDR
jgi:hypothetical protein